MARYCSIDRLKLVIVIVYILYIVTILTVYEEEKPEIMFKVQSWVSVALICIAQIVYHARASFPFPTQDTFSGVGEELLQDMRDDYRKRFLGEDNSRFFDQVSNTKIPFNSPNALLSPTQRLYKSPKDESSRTPSSDYFKHIDSPVFTDVLCPFCATVIDASDKNTQILYLQKHLTVHLTDNDV